MLQLKLNESETYHVVKKLEDEIEKIKAKNDEMEEDVNMTLSNQKVNEMIQNLTELVNKRNEKLIEELKI